MRKAGSDNEADSPTKIPDINEKNAASQTGKQTCFIYLYFRRRLCRLQEPDPLIGGVVKNKGNSTSTVFYSTAAS